MLSFHRGKQKIDPVRRNVFQLLNPAHHRPDEAGLPERASFRVVLTYAPRPN